MNESILYGITSASILDALGRSTYNCYMVLNVTTQQHMYVSSDISKIFGIGRTEVMSTPWNELLLRFADSKNMMRLNRIFAETERLFHRKKLPLDSTAISLNMKIRQPDGTYRSINHKYVPVKISPCGNVEVVLIILSLSTNSDNFSDVMLKDSHNNKTYAWKKDHWEEYKVPKCTDAERRIIDQLVLGKAQKEIAEELGCSEKTIKAHCVNILKKFKAPNILSAIMRIVHFDLFRKHP